MALTILIYAGFTGLCATAGSWQELALYRFMTGLGIGGEWSAGAALIAETWPARSRAKAAGIMQASGGIGLFLASLLYLFIGPYGWRWVFALGILPAIVAFYIRRTLKEPERWVQAKATRNPLPSLFYKTGAARHSRRHRHGRCRDLRVPGRHSMGSQLGQRFTSGARAENRYTSGESGHKRSKRRRHRRLSLLSSGSPTDGAARPR